MLQALVIIIALLLSGPAWAVDQFLEEKAMRPNRIVVPQSDYDTDDVYVVLRDVHRFRGISCRLIATSIVGETTGLEGITQIFNPLNNAWSWNGTASTALTAAGTLEWHYAPLGTTTAFAGALADMTAFVTYPMGDKIRFVFTCDAADCQYAMYCYGVPR